MSREYMKALAKWVDAKIELALYRHTYRTARISGYQERVDELNMQIVEAENEMEEITSE